MKIRFRSHWPRRRILNISLVWDEISSWKYSFFNYSKWPSIVEHFPEATFTVNYEIFSDILKLEISASRKAHNIMDNQYFCLPTLSTLEIWFLILIENFFRIFLRRKETTRETFVISLILTDSWLSKQQLIRLGKLLSDIFNEFVVLDLHLLLLLLLASFSDLRWVGVESEMEIN